MQNLFTVGYSGHDQRSFTSILLDSNIDVICDVRSTPYSRYKPEFSRAPLKKILNDVGMKYDVTPAFHPAATRDRPLLSRRSAGEATVGFKPDRCFSSSAAKAAGVA